MLGSTRARAAANAASIDKSEVSGKAGGGGACVISRHQVRRCPPTLKMLHYTARLYLGAVCQRPLRPTERPSRMCIFPGARVANGRRRQLFCRQWLSPRRKLAAPKFILPKACPGTLILGRSRRSSRASFSVGLVIDGFDDALENGGYGLNRLIDCCCLQTTQYSVREEIRARRERSADRVLNHTSRQL